MNGGVLSGMHDASTDLKIVFYQHYEQILSLPNEITSDNSE